MSFKDNYRNQIESISTDGYLRKRVLEKLEKKQKKSVFPKFGAVAVTAVCFLLAVTIAIPQTRDWFGDMLSSENESSIGETASEDYIAEVEDENAASLKNLSYDEIYDKVSQFLGDSEGVDMGGGVYMYAKDDKATTATGGTSNKNSANAENKGNDYSKTTAQVDGVDEADVVKTDGEYIYALNVRDRKVRIIKAGKEPKVISSIYLENPNYYQNLYIGKDRLVIFGTKIDSALSAPTKDDASTYKMYDSRVSEYSAVAYIYDISNPEKAKLLTQCKQSGEYSDSRLIGDKLYMVSNHYVNTNDMSKDDISTFVPSVECKNYNKPIDNKCIYMGAVCNSPSYTVICGYDITDGSLKGSQSVLGGTYALYCSTENIITAGYENNNKTAITRYQLKDGKIILKAEGEIKGSLLNQFSIDEYKGNFRFVSTYTYGEEGKNEINGSSGTVYYKLITGNMLTVLDGDLKQVGSIEKIAPDERIYSVRFMGDMAYFVTFRQVDPLFSADLSNPENPKIVGALKIPGFSNYLFPYGENQLLGIGQDADEKTGRTKGVKLSLFDISNPADVKEASKEILDFSTSDALYNHKRAMISYEKNIIGFDFYDNGRGYLIYGVENGKFIKKAQFDLGNASLYVKGLYINDEFYIVTGEKLITININDYKVINELEF